MVDFAAIAALTSSLKATSDIAKAAIGLRDAEMLRGKVIEMQGEIRSALGSAVSAQMDQLALLERVRGMEGQIANLEAWSAKKQRYELHAWPTGVFTYRLKDGVHPPEPAHHICAACYEAQKSYILNRSDDMYNDRLRCPHCNLTIGIGANDKMQKVEGQMRSAPRRRSDFWDH